MNLPNQDKPVNQNPPDKQPTIELPPMMAPNATLYVYVPPPKTVIRISDNMVVLWD